MSSDAARRFRVAVAVVSISEAALAALLIVVVTGIALVIVYDPADPLTSVALMRLANPAAAFVRNLHYWSTQALLVLSVIHVWQHMARASDQRMRVGPWLRTCLAVPALGVLAWSGFVLKGDVEAQQALRVVHAAVSGIPWMGTWLATALVGNADEVLLVYLHHAATFTVFLVVVVIEHGRLLWPRPVMVATVVLPLSLLSLVASPSLHDGLDAVVKGPWFLLGMQEAFHWSSSPGLVLIVSAIPLAVLAALRWSGLRQRRIMLAALVTVATVYAALTVIGWGFRGRNWEWTTEWRAQPSPVTWGWVVRPGSPPALADGASVPLVMGRPEGCLVCHPGVTGLSSSHDPAVIGCASCHGGNTFSLDASMAHAGMRVVPGNLADASRSCGGECHASIVARVDGSIMSTLSGIVSVNRRVWGETHDARTLHDIRRIGFTPADSHLRGLCAGCHLGAPKSEPGPIGEESRGGGCTACHVRYAPAALDELRRVEGERARGVPVTPARVHPDVTVKVDDTACFGCHSRSGRISLSYAGWHEVDESGPPAGARTRTLDDGRTLVAATPDAHFTKGMACIDCHTAREVMGDGTRHARKADQQRVTCDDCHRAGALPTRERGALDEESRRIVALRKLATGGRPLVVSASGDVFVNAFVDRDGSARLLRKGDGATLALRPPAAACTRASHQRVACVTCHTAWAPRCTGCHTRFDPDGEGYDLLVDQPTRGEWIEKGAHFVAVPPTMGVRRTKAGADVFDPFIPGMVATFEHRGPADSTSTTRFRRLYARAFSHTVTKAGRTCQSCHNDAVALGYGEGQLTFATEGPARGQWQFVPAHPSSPADGLPDDAWIGMLVPREGMTSTQDDLRPLSIDEQRKVLAVGACLTCHAPDSAVMTASLDDWPGVQRRMSPRCVRQAP